MSNFPFAPFLASLAEDGIPITLHDYRRVSLLLKTGGPWTLDRVRDSLLALLTNDPEQQEIFLRRFEQSFQTDTAVSDELAAADVDQILQELATLAPVDRGESASRTASPEKVPTTGSTVPASRQPEAPPRPLWQQWSAVAAALLFVGLLIVIVAPRFPLQPADVATATPAPLETSSPASEADAAGLDSELPKERVYKDVPIFTVTHVKAERSQAWQRYAWLALILALASIGFAFYLWHSRKTPDDQEPSFSEEGVRYFPLGSIGGRPQARISDTVLDELADSMGYFLSEERGEVLDIAASIRTTMARGGIPELAYRRRTTLRSLLILEDAFAETTAWNSIAQELSVGMGSRGVSVLHGRFFGSPDLIRFEQGPVVRLEDIEDQRNGYVVLLFTDGKGLNWRDSVFALESLGRWPFVAWMELRDEKIWDASTALPGDYGIPVYPASSAGVVLALRRFLTEHGADIDFARQTTNGQGVASYADKRFDVYVEEQLGDAYGWAQDCAMFQPVSLALADGLRQTFHPHIPPRRIDRLLALPGTKNNVAGIRFRDDVLRVLRRAFLDRRPEAEQVAVLKHIVAEIDAVEPSDSNSLAHLAWEASRERVRLEYDQDDALKRLAQLAKTPIGGSISATLEGYGLPDQADRIPLRMRPDNKDAWQRLARISDAIEVPASEAYPVRWWQWATLGMFVLVTLSLVGWTAIQYRQSGRMLHPIVEGETGDVFARLDLLADGQIEPVPVVGGWLETVVEANVEPGKTYRLTLYEDGFHFEALVEPVWGNYPKIVLSDDDQSLPCVEPVAGTGITIYRCPTDRPPRPDRPLRPFHEHEYALSEHGLSIGIEIDTAGGAVSRGAWLRNLLLHQNAVDLVFVVRPYDVSDFHTSALEVLMRQRVGPLLSRSQILVWHNGKLPDSVLSPGLLNRARAHRLLPPMDDRLWTDEPSTAMTYSDSVFLPVDELAASITDLSMATTTETQLDDEHIPSRFGGENALLPEDKSVVSEPLSHCEENEDFAPNNTRGETQTVLISGQTIQSNFCGPEDTDDIFIITVTTPSKISVHLANIPEDVDYDLYLYEGLSGDFVAKSNTTGNDDEKINYRAKAGVYFVRVYPYSLEIFPDTGFGQEPYTLVATLLSLGENALLPEDKSVVSVPLSHCEDNEDFAPNNTRGETQTVLISGQTIQSNFCGPEDTDDLFIITVTTPSEISVHLANIPEDTDYDLYLYEGLSGDFVAKSSTSGDLEENIDYYAQAGTHFVRVHRFSLWTVPVIAPGQLPFARDQVPYAGGVETYSLEATFK